METVNTFANETYWNGVAPFYWTSSAPALGGSGSLPAGAGFALIEVGVSAFPIWSLADGQAYMGAVVHISGSGSASPPFTGTPDAGYLSNGSGPSSGGAGDIFRIPSGGSSGSGSKQFVYAVIPPAQWPGWPGPSADVDAILDALRVPTPASGPVQLFSCGFHLRVVAGAVGTAGGTATGSVSPVTIDVYTRAIGTISALSPNHGDSSTLVTITGSNFDVPPKSPDNTQTYVTIKFNGVAATGVVLVGGTYQCHPPSLAPGTLADVVITTPLAVNPAGSAETITKLAAFRYDLPRSITAITPTTDSPAGGATATITGAGFNTDDTGATTPMITALRLRKGGTTIAITDFTILDDTHISARIPARTAGASAGLYDIVADVAAGAPTPLVLASAFSYFGIGPNNGPTIGGTVVTVVWAYTPTSITVDGIPVTYNPATTSFQTPAHAAGMVDIVLTSTGHPTQTVPYTFWVPVVFLPSGASPSGGTVITAYRTESIPEAAFQAGAAFLVNGLQGTTPTRLDENTYTFVAPPHPASSVAVPVDMLNLDARGLAMRQEHVLFYTGSTAAPRTTISPDQVAQGPLPATVTLTATITNPTWTGLWTQTGGPAPVAIATPTQPVTTVTFTVYTPGRYTFEFCASDPSGQMPRICKVTHVTLDVPRLTKLTITGV